MSRVRLTAAYATPTETARQLAQGDVGEKRSRMRCSRAGAAAERSTNSPWLAPPVPAKTRGGKSAPRPGYCISHRRRDSASFPPCCFNMLQHDELRQRQQRNGRQHRYAHARSTRTFHHRLRDSAEEHVREITGNDKNTCMRKAWIKSILNSVSHQEGIWLFTCQVAGIDQ